MRFRGELGQIFTLGFHLIYQKDKTPRFLDGLQRLTDNSALVPVWEPALCRLRRAPDVACQTIKRYFH
jgi:hypothetical protein